MKSRNLCLRKRSKLSQNAIQYWKYSRLHKTSPAQNINDGNCKRLVARELCFGRGLAPSCAFTDCTLLRLQTQFSSRLPAPPFLIYHHTISSSLEHATWHHLTECKVICGGELIGVEFLRDYLACICESLVGVYIDVGCVRVWMDD